MSDPSPQNQSQLDQIFQKAPLGILMVDSEYRVLESNPALLKSLGFDNKYLQKRCFMDLCHLHDRSMLEDLFYRAENSPGRYLQAEVRLLKEDGAYLWTEVIVGVNPPGDELPGRYLVIFQDIEQRKEIELEVVELHRRLNDRVEGERAQLAQDLHDGPLQDLHSIQYQLSAFQGILTPEDGKQIDAIMNSVNQVKEELRTISYDLRPPVLSRFGLAKSIQSHAKQFVERHPDFKLDLDLVDDGTLLDEEIRLALFRIFQQALGNILQHSEASEIKVALHFQGPDVEMIIQDDGKGFQLPDRWISLVREGHYGLAGSHDRVNSLGGDFQLHSNPGEGTVLRVRLHDVLVEEE